MDRTDERSAEATVALAEALQALGVQAEPLASVGDGARDLIIGNPASPVVQLDATYRAHPSPREVAALPDLTQDRVVRVLVAERLSPAARHVLNARGWAWLDLSGHLRLVRWPVVIDADVPAREPSVERRRPVLATDVGLDVACALLANPVDRLSVRRVVNITGRSISSVHRTLTALDDAGLRSRKGLPVTPDLFWEAAGQWRPRRLPLRRVPKTTDEPTALLEMRVDGGSPAAGVAGWAIGGDVAARVWGAEMVATSEYPVDFYVPSDNVLRAALSLYEEAPFHDRAATVALPPARWACRQRLAASRGTGTQGSRWPLVHPLFVALDLAQDPARGREVLATWEPEDYVGVWRD
jgi:hypothetical protein